MNAPTLTDLVKTLLDSTIVSDGHHLLTWDGVLHGSIGEDFTLHYVVFCTLISSTIVSYGHLLLTWNSSLHGSISNDLALHHIVLAGQGGN